MKLKSLTLAGFKSFADKTTFDFHDGVTCVVGPNGCGKSNVVDAIKWVLGEQSPKSLRGGEMLDVLFNGTSQRRSAGYAEVTLTFEDVAGVLRLPGAEGEEANHAVTVGRRLYRNGESEYLVNKQVVRLRDIREMFMDTGIGVRAYSLIEQGKVETFLQASPTDRRVVFDEAAGISKYKSRKREALRRLERVEQNLLRLTDILAEVQKRLRSIKYQAGKARSYQAYSARLKELRALFSLAEYHRLSLQRKQLQGECDGLADKLAGLSAQIDRLEAARTATETELADLETHARALDGRIAAAAAEMTTCQQRAEMLTARAAELGEGIVAGTARCERLEARIEDSAAEAASGRRRLLELDEQLQQLSRRDQSLRAEHADGAEKLRRLQGQLEDEKNGTIDLLRRTAQLHNEINQYSLRRENLHTQRQRLAGRAEEVAQALEGLLARRAALEAKLQDVQAVLSESESRLQRTHGQSAELGQTAQRLGAQLSQAEKTHSALLSRKAALEEMQSRLAGVGEGVRRALKAARDGELPFLHGMVGEFIEADVEHARVIEAALAGAEQRLVASGLAQVLAAGEQLKTLLADTDGVEIVCLDQLAPASAGPAAPTPPGALARASQWVRCEERFAPLLEAILGKTLVVESLEKAVEIARHSPGSYRFVTLSGQVLEADGRVRIGAGRSAAGVIWRKSELGELARQLEQSQQHIGCLDEQNQQVRSELAHLEEVTASLRTAIYEATTERVEHQAALQRAQEQIADLRREGPLLDEEVRQLAEEIESAVRAEHEAQQGAAELEALRAQRESEIARLGEALAQAAQAQEARTGELTAAQVALAQARQQRSATEEALRRSEQHCQALSSELSGLREQIEQSRRRRAEAEAAAEESRSRIGTLSLEKAALAREAEENAESRRSLQQRIGEIRNQLAGDRKRHDELAGQLNELRVRLSEVEVRVDSLISRTAEELSMDLPAAYPGYVHDEDRDWEAVRAEIAELRGKIDRLGNVNLDAITEQDELSVREKFLTGQLEDIRTSQRKLNDLIRRINAESRRRFEEALQSVREHFNELFRKLFGGGKADILLTDPEDPLESGVEIFARPPGKELRSITLLSGGEKTMTALALLFSFFRSRPSPFCVLDEVDAALDEANTQRFVHLVREFLQTSQFVIVSHAKRTIGMADQIYGVTMQEPGVSRQVSVRFEEAAQMAERPAAQAVGA